MTTRESQNTKEVRLIQERMERIERELLENTKTTERIEAATSEIIDVFVSFKSAFKVLNWIGKLAKPLGAIAALVAAVTGIWVSVKTGEPLK